EENTRADALSKFKVMITGVKERKIIVIVRERASIEEGEMIQCMEEERSWNNEIEEYLVQWTEPRDPIAKTKANGQTEVLNRILLQHLKIRLNGAKGSWVQELPGVLWAYGLRQDNNRGDSVLLGLWVGSSDTYGNRAYAKILHYKGLMMRSYNSRVKPKNFQIGDLVLKKVEVSKHIGKLDPN
ncbi:UNVERIFIED_CONTAM: hypothetical protein Scaly_0995200, partial [Sesamum calycinum]